MTSFCIKCLVWYCVIEVVATQFVVAYNFDDSLFVNSPETLFTPAQKQNISCPVLDLHSSLAIEGFAATRLSVVIPNLESSTNASNSPCNIEQCRSGSYITPLPSLVIPTNLHSPLSEPFLQPQSFPGLNCVPWTCAFCFAILAHLHL